MQSRKRASTCYCIKSGMVFDNRVLKQILYCYPNEETFFFRKMTESIKRKSPKCYNYFMLIWQFVCFLSFLSLDGYACTLSEKRLFQRFVIFFSIFLYNGNLFLCQQFCILFYQYLNEHFTLVILQLNYYSHHLNILKFSFI